MKLPVQITPSCGVGWGQTKAYLIVTVETAPQVLLLAFHLVQVSLAVLADYTRILTIICSVLASVLFLFSSSEILELGQMQKYFTTAGWHSAAKPEVHTCDEWTAHTIPLLMFWLCILLFFDTRTAEWVA